MSDVKPPSIRSTLLLAHTARCKLQLAADRPDRNLRFILGHAFTLDKLMLRVVEIENSGLDFDDEEELNDHTGVGRLVCAPVHGAGHGQRGKEDEKGQQSKVKFRSTKVRSLKDPVVVSGGQDSRRRSPPPKLDTSSSSSDEDEDYVNEYDDFDDDDEEEDTGLSLRRFASGTARPPRMPDLTPSSKDQDGDNSSSSEDEDEPKSPPPLPMPSEAKIKQLITSGEENGELKELYKGVAGCPCHGQDVGAPVVRRAWDLPREMMEKDLEGGLGERVVALVEVEA